MVDSQAQKKEEVREQQYILTNGGQPFQNEQVAKVSMESKQLDPEDYIVVKLKESEEMGAGFAIKNINYGIAMEYRGYWHVTFSDRTHPNDTPDVHLSVGGETLIAQRGKKTIVPGRFLEASDHATYPHFRQVPNQPRKRIGQIKEYPYERHGKATRQEYLALLESGNKKQQENINKYGFDYEPDEE